MKQRINQILRNCGLKLSEFYIANGARSKESEIHLNVKGKIKNEKYAVQFEDESRIVVIWNVEKRKKSDASLDLYWSPSQKLWKEIDGCYEINIGVKNKQGEDTGETSKVVAIPIDELEDYLKFKAIKSQLDENNDDQILSSKRIEEGGRIQIYTTRYERNPQLRVRAIEIHGCICTVCGFDFEKRYGELGKGYIEVHHIKPLSECGGKHEVNPETDMVCVCPNCHRMIHRKETLSVEELKNLIK